MVQIGSNFSTDPFLYDPGWNVVTCIQQITENWLTNVALNSLFDNFNKVYFGENWSIDYICT